MYDPDEKNNEIKIKRTGVKIQDCPLFEIETKPNF